MDRAQKGLAGVILGIFLVGPGHLMQGMIGSPGSSIDMILEILKMLGVIVLIGVPLLFWAVLPYLDKHNA